MRAAVSSGAGLAGTILVAWLGWWLLASRTDTAARPVTALLCGVLVVAWVAGSGLVWRQPLAAAGTFAAAAVLPLTPEQGLPAPSLLIAVSAALAVWSVLASLLPSRERRALAPYRPADQGPAEWEPQEPARTCVICHGPSSTVICAPCAAALGPQIDLWCTDPDDGR